MPEIEESEDLSFESSDSEDTDISYVGCVSPVTSDDEFSSDKDSEREDSVQDSAEDETQPSHGNTIHVNIMQLLTCCYVQFHNTFMQISPVQTNTCTMSLIHLCQGTEQQNLSIMSILHQGNIVCQSTYVCIELILHHMSLMYVCVNV